MKFSKKLMLSFIISIFIIPIFIQFNLLNLLPTSTDFDDRKTINSEGIPGVADS